MSIRADDWNALLDEVCRNTLLSVTTVGQGNAESHPWATRPSWQPDLREWQCTVKPGFVNGLDVTVLAIDGDVPLTDSPVMPLTAWRSVGSDAGPEVSGQSEDGTLLLSYEPVPEFFVARGVVSRQQVSIDVDDPTGLLDAIEDSGAVDSLRLRACDLVLYHDRPSLAADERGRPMLAFTSGTRRAAYLRTTRRYRADDIGSARDSLHIATIYMLSPPDTGYDAEVDETWTPFVKHECFWNLCYDWKPTRFGTANELTLETNLAGDVGDPLIQGILAQNNADYQAALDALTTNPITGHFWSV
jgi:hypothetical protein